MQEDQPHFYFDIKYSIKILENQNIEKALDVFSQGYQIDNPLYNSLQISQSEIRQYFKAQLQGYDDKFLQMPTFVLQDVQNKGKIIGCCYNRDVLNQQVLHKDISEQWKFKDQLEKQMLEEEIAKMKLNHGEAYISYMRILPEYHSKDLAKSFYQFIALYLYQQGYRKQIDITYDSNLISTLEMFNTVNIHKMVDIKWNMFNGKPIAPHSKQLMCRVISHEFNEKLFNQRAKFSQKFTQDTKYYIEQLDYYYKNERSKMANLHPKL